MTRRKASESGEDTPRGRSSSRGRPATTPADELAGAGSPQDEEYGDDDDAEIDAALEATAPAGAAKVYIWRFVRDQDTGSEDWLRLPSVSVAGFDPDQLARRHGGGRFKLRFVDNNGQFIGNRYLNYAEIPLEAAPAPPAQLATGGSDLLEKMLLQQMNFNQQMMLAIVQSKGGGGSTADVLEALKVGSELGRTSSPVEGGIELFREGLKLAHEYQGRGDSEEGGLMGIAGHLATIVTKIMERPTVRRVAPGGAPSAEANRALPAGTPGAEPAGGDVGASSLAPAPTPPSAAEKIAQLAEHYAPILLAEATAGRDAYRFGSFIAERCPPGYVSTLDRFLQLEEPQRFEIFANAEPQFYHHRRWLGELCDGVAEALDELYGDESEEGSEDVLKVKADPDSEALAGRNGRVANGPHPAPDHPDGGNASPGQASGGGAQQGSGSE